MGALRGIKRKMKKALKLVEGPFPIAQAGRERVEQIVAQAQAEVSAAMDRQQVRLNEVALAYRAPSGVPEDGDFTLDLDTFTYRPPKESDKGGAPPDTETEMPEVVEVDEEFEAEREAARAEMSSEDTGDGGSWE